MVVARRVGRGIAVLAVVGLCLPLLIWMFGEPEREPLPTASQQAVATASPLRARAQAPAPRSADAPASEPAPLASADADERDAGERPTPPAHGIGPEPSWADPAAWGNPVEVTPSAAPVYTATITGRVVDPHGQPVPGVSVSGVLGIISCWGGPAANQTTGQRAITGPDGRFRLQISSEHMLPTHVGLSPPKKTDLLPNQHELEGLGQGDERDLGDLALIQGGRVEGRVTDPTGRPLAGALIRTQQGPLVLDRALGGAGVDQLLSWGQTVDFVDTSSPSVVHAEWSGDPVLTWGQEVEPVDTRSSDLVVSGERTFRSGIILDTSRQIAGPSTTSRADGSFTLHRVPPGNHTLVASLRPYAVARRDAVVVRAGLATRGVQLQLTPGPVLEVEVLDERGVPIAGALVTGSDDEGGSFNGVTNARGIATSPPLTSSRFDLQVSAPGQRRGASVATAPRGAERFRVRVTLAAASELRLQVDPAGSVFAIRRGDQTWLNPEVEGESLVFRELQPGRYDVMSSGAEGVGVLARDVVIRAGEKLDLGRVSPTPLEELRVRVLDPQGQPVAGATLQPSEPMLGTASTDERGEAILTLWPGDHPHRISAFPHAETTRVLRGGGHETIRLQPASSFLTVHAGPARDESGAPRARQLTLHRAEGTSTSVTFVEQTRVPLPGPGRYVIDVDGYACGEVQVRAGQELTFEAQEPSPIEVQVTVLGPQGRPLPGAEVSITTTDPRGTTPSLTPAISAPGAHTDAQGVAKTRFVRGPSSREAFAQVVSAGQTRVFRFPLPEGSSAQQVVQFSAETSVLEIDARAVGRPGASIELAPLTAQGARIQYATLDASGQASFSSVLPGRYRVSLGQGSSRVVREVEVGASGASITLASS